MQLPAEAKPAIWGAIGGAIALAVIGFTWGGWVTGGSVAASNKQAASKAVIAVLAPICVDNYARATDTSKQLTELKKISSWQQAAFVEKAGWAKIPGIPSVDSGMATACAEMIIALKS